MLNDDTNISILVVDDEELIRNLIKRTLSRFENYEIVCAANGKEALEVYNEVNPICVFCDIVMPVMDGITFLEKLKELHPESKVVLLSGYGTEEMIIRALRAGAINYLKKPLKIEDIILITQKLVSLYFEEQQKKLNILNVQEESKKLVIENKIYEISSIINQLLLCATNVCKPSSLIGLRTGLYEIIMNAIEHGNLQITFEEKSNAFEEDRYTTLLDERFNTPEFSERKVTIEYSMNKDRLKFIVCDEGDGFDWRTVTYQDDLESLSRPHGRGIVMTKFYFDEVIFNEKGNEVTLIKYSDIN